MPARKAGGLPLSAYKKRIVLDGRPLSTMAAFLLLEQALFYYDPHFNPTLCYSDEGGILVMQLNNSQGLRCLPEKQAGFL